MSVIILSAVSGAGKSTMASAIKAMANDARCYCVDISADKAFVRPDGVYDFVPARLPEAHGMCLRDFVNLVADPKAMVIVDNTNTTLAEVAPYAALALAYGHDLLRIVLAVDPEVAHARNTHGVPLVGVQAQHARITASLRELPPWWPQVVVDSSDDDRWRAAVKGMAAFEA